MRVRRLVVGELQTNCFLLSDDQGETVIIDPGGDPERVEDALVSYQLTPRLIVCTHGHPDHTFGVGRLQSDFNIDMLVHELDRPMVEAGAGELEFFFDMSDYIEPAFGPSLTDGQTLEAGSLRIQVIHTPGHTPGGVSLLCGSELFSGDTLFAGGVGRTDLPGGSQETLMRSIQTRLLVLDDNTRVYPGHGRDTTIGEEKRSNPWLR